MGGEKQRKKKRVLNLFWGGVIFLRMPDSDKEIGGRLSRKRGK